MTHHPEDLASVTAANRDRLMGVAAAISTITNSERHMIDLADLEAKARAATHGEWSVLTSRLDSTRSIMAGDPAFFLARCHKSPVSDATANAAYIVAAQPSVVLELIERIRAAEAKAGEPVAWRYETDAEHIARDMKEGRFPERSPKQQVPPFHAAPVDTAALVERVKTLEEALRSTLAALVATTSLLVRADQERVRPSRAVASDAMFRQMLKDYDNATIAARTALGGSNE